MQEIERTKETKQHFILHPSSQQHTTLAIQSIHLNVHTGPLGEGGERGILRGPGPSLGAKNVLSNWGTHQTPLLLCEGCVRLGTAQVLSTNRMLQTDATLSLPSPLITVAVVGMESDASLSSSLSHHLYHVLHALLIRWSSQCFFSSLMFLGLSFV